MNSNTSAPEPGDALTVGFKITTRLLLVLVLALLLKTWCVDTVKVKTAQMSPAILKGDRILLFRLGYGSSPGGVAGPRANQVAVFSDPGRPQEYRCLRVVGLGGDSVEIIDGKFVNRSRELKNSYGLDESEELLPASYSPRDHMAPYRVPRKGDHFLLDSLTLRDLVFLALIIRHENPKKQYYLRPLVYEDGEPVQDCDLSEFTLYKGSIDSIPDNLAFDAYFWQRLREYLSRRSEAGELNLTLWLEEDGNHVAEYRVKQSYIFLLADNWKTGYDSRYFGPVGTTTLRGRALCVLWSWDDTTAGPASLRAGRIVKLIR